MNVELTRVDLEALVSGSHLHYSEFENPLVIKAGHGYNDQYGWTIWDNLFELTDEELWQLRRLCVDSWLSK